LKEGDREKRKKVGEVVRDTKFLVGGGEQETISPVLKAPRQCSLVF
jgi:hypothetical protein